MDNYRSTLMKYGTTYIEYKLKVGDIIESTDFIMTGDGWSTFQIAQCKVGLPWKEYMYPAYRLTPQK